MGIATSMRELTQDILSSTEERASKLAELRGETRTLRREAVGMVKDFSTSRHEASRQLRQQLAQSNADRIKEVTESLKDAKNLVKGFHDSRKESGDQLRKELDQDEKNRKQQVKGTLDNFQSSRQETSTELRRDLAEGRERIESEVKETLADAEAMISGYQSSRHEMGAQLRTGLARNRKGMKTEVEGMRNDFRKNRAEVRADLKEASDTWREMNSAIHNKKSGDKTSPEVPIKRPAETAPDLNEKLLSVINQHVVGITLSEATETLGLATIVLGKAAKALQEQGKIRKEGKLYFPVTT